MALPVYPGRASQDTESVPHIEHNLYSSAATREALRRGQLPASFLWENKALRLGVNELGRTHGIDVWLDRRLDPQQEISLRFPAESAPPTLYGALMSIAKLAGAAVGMIENIAYIGPIESVARVQCAAVVLYDRMHRFSGDRSPMAPPLEWADISSYNDILAQIAQGSGWSIAGRLPHDLLHAGRWNSPATLATQLTLLLAGFDMTAEPTGPRALRLVPLGKNTEWQTIYQPSELVGTRLSPTAIQQLQRRFPSARAVQQPSGWHVSGPTDFHLALMTPPPPQLNANASRWQRMRWTFQVKNKPAKVVLDSLSTSIGFDTHWSSTALEKGNQTISFEVANADLDTLLQAFARASGLQVIRQGSVVQIDHRQSQ